MTRAEFAKQVKEILEEQGYKKVRVSTSLFGKKADITAKDPNGKKRLLKAGIVYKKGKEYTRINDPCSLDWIDKIEEFDAFMN